MAAGDESDNKIRLSLGEHRRMYPTPFRGPGVLAALMAIGLGGAARAQEVDEEEAVVVSPARTATPAAPAREVVAAPVEVSTATVVTPVVPAEPVGTFHLPGDIRVRFRGYVHAEAVAWDESSVDALDPSTGRPLNDTRFLIRRARLRAEVDRGFLSGGLELDANTVDGATARVITAEVTARWPGAEDGGVPLVAASIGLFKTPFGAATREKAEKRLYLEVPTFVRAYYPGEYDLGLAIHGGWGALRYVVAAMNGDPIGEARVGGRDVTASKDLLGRLGVDLSPVDGVRLEVGTSALIGEGLSPGKPTTKDELVWRDVNENGLVELTELQVIAGAAATAPALYDRFALGADARVTVDVPVLGQAVVFGELVWAGNLDRGVYVADPVVTGRDLRELGWSVGAYSDLGPWFRLGLRFDAYDPDADAADAQGGVRVPIDATLSTLSVVLQWRPIELGYLAMSFDHNDNARGRAADGTPARFPDDALTFRAAIEL